VSTAVAARPICGPNWVGSIQKTSHDMNTMMVSGRMIFQR